MIELVIHVFLNHLDRNDDFNYYSRCTDDCFSILQGQPRPKLCC